MQARFEQHLTRLVGFLPNKSIGISVSGGVDSMALCSLAQRWAKPRNVQLHGFIVDHGIRSDSKEEQEKVAKNLESLDIVPHKLSISLAGVPKSKTELVARNLRIAALRSACTAQNIEYLLYGHHKDDQYETYLMRKLQHSGWYGLAGMRSISYLDSSPQPPGAVNPVKSVRPLLDLNKSHLIEWCTTNKIPWFEDPTNRDPSLTIRNTIRKLKSEFSTVLPRSIQPETVWSTQESFRQLRDRTDQEARALWVLGLQDGSIELDTVKGTATLDIAGEFSVLSVDSKVSLILKLVSFATPLDMRSLSYRRKNIKEFVESGYTKKNIADVIIEEKRGKLVFKRSELRQLGKADQTDRVNIYSATKAWSQWHFIDRRYWMRWRLPKQSKIEKRYVAVYMNQGEHIRRIREELQHLGSLAHGECTTQPLFAFTDSSSSVQELDISSLIGYPVLSRYQNLEVECQYKQLPK